MPTFSLFDWMVGVDTTSILTIRLYVTRTNPLPEQPVVADFTEASYTGYTRRPFPPADGSVLLTGGGAGITSLPLLWPGPADDSGQIIQGVLYVAHLVDSEEVVIGWEDFETDQPLLNPSQLVNGVASWTATPYVVTVP